MKDPREPSIHINESYLRQIVEEYCKKTSWQVFSIDDLVNDIMIYGKKYTLTHRKKLERYDTKTKRANFQLKSSSIEAARIFAGLLKNIREHELHHRGITRIREGTRDWGAIKECTEKASAFGITYSLGQREAFITYIRTYFKTNGNSKGRFNLGAMSARYELICSAYEAQRDIEQDPTPESTRKAYNQYISQVAERTGISQNLESDPLKYVFFVYAKEIAKKFGLTPQQYIQAQFDTLDWTNGIPMPNQLVTQNAEQRTVKWMAENGIKKEVKRDPKQAKEFWNKIKKYDHRAEP